MRDTHLTEICSDLFFGIKEISLIRINVPIPYMFVFCFDLLIQLDLIPCVIF